MVVCILVLHMYSQPVIWKCLQRMQYLYHHADLFEQTFLPFMVTFMKMSIELATELINVYVSYTVTYDEIWVVMCFSAMCLINYIDE